MKSLIISALLILIPCLTGCDATEPVSRDSIYKNGARTYYEAIDFSSPETTSEAFISAWRSGDYISFFALLESEIQGELWAAFTRSYLQWFFPEKSKEIENMMRDDVSDIKTRWLEEGMYDPNLLIDTVFIAAEKCHALPFTLGEKAVIQDINRLDINKAKVTIMTGENPEKIILWLERTRSSKRWKITYIQLPVSTLQTPLWGGGELEVM